MNWRDEKNSMTVEQRARALNAEQYNTFDDDEQFKEYILEMATFGHVCANAELERHRETQRKLAAAESERDEARATLEQVQEDLRDCQKEQRDDEAIYMKVVADAHAQRDALLAALKKIDVMPSIPDGWMRTTLMEMRDIAREAIAAAQGGRG